VVIGAAKFNSAVVRLPQTFGAAKLICAHCYLVPSVGFLRQQASSGFDG
jgi:hypothetical protein